MAVLYRIHDWDHHFENSESRKVKSARWIAIPNKHDGKGYRRLTRHERAVELFCAWCLIVEVASKMPVRGVLADRDGPLTPEDLSDATGFPSAIFDLALKVLSTNKFGWICYEDHPDGIPVHPGVSGCPGVEGKGREGNEEKSGVPDLPATNAGTPPADELADHGAVATDHGGIRATAENPPTQSGIDNGATTRRPRSRTRGDASNPVPRKPPSGPHAELIAHFTAGWFDNYGTAYSFQNAKDGAAVGRILKSCGDDLAKAKRIVSDFLSDSDPFIATTGHTLAILGSQLNRYLAGAHKAPASPVALRGRHANQPPPTPAARQRPDN